MSYLYHYQSCLRYNTKCIGVSKIFSLIRGWLQQIENRKLEIKHGSILIHLSINLAYDIILSVLAWVNSSLIRGWLQQIENRQLGIKRGSILTAIKNYFSRLQRHLKLMAIEGNKIFMAIDNAVNNIVTI